MIRYALACDRGHEFESWFPSSGSYDAQTARGLVECPVCGSTKVEKRLMSPALAKRDGVAPKAVVAEPAAQPAPDQTPTPTQPVALLSEREVAIRTMLRAVREHVAKTADYVGPSFADEARKMHTGEIEHRSIYGEASPAEARALVEDGIEIQALPIAPDDRN